MSLSRNGIALTYGSLKKSDPTLYVNVGNAAPRKPFVGSSRCWLNSSCTQKASYGMRL